MYQKPMPVLDVLLQEKYSFISNLLPAVSLFASCCKPVCTKSVMLAQRAMCPSASCYEPIIRPSNASRTAFL